MSRAMLRSTVRAGGVPVINARVYPRVHGTTDAVTGVWDSETDGTEVTFVDSNSQGEAILWFDTPQRIDLKTTDNSDRAYKMGAVGDLLTFADFTETIDVQPHPTDVALTANVVTLAGAQTIAGAKTFSGVNRFSGVTNFDANVRFKKNPFVDASHPDFGANGTGGDDTAAIQAAVDSLGTVGLSGTVQLQATTPPGSAGFYGLSAPIRLAGGIKLKGVAPGIASSASPTKLKALPGFTGEALLKSNTWDEAIKEWWHWGAVEDLTLLCAGIAPAGVAIHQAGEESVLRRVNVYDPTDSGFLLTGYHAPATFELCSSWNPGSGYGYKFTVHPGARAADGNGGVIRMFGVSGDTGDAGSVAFIYVDGSQTLHAFGIKAELWPRILHIAGSSHPRVFLSGDAIRAEPAAGEVVQIDGTARPAVVLNTLRVTQYTNIVVDNVISKTLAAPNLATDITQVIWGPRGISATEPLVHQLLGGIIQSNGDARSALRLRRYSATASSNIFTVEDESGNVLCHVSPSGILGITGNLAGTIIVVPHATTPSIQFNASGVPKAQIMATPGGSVNIDTLGQFAVRDALNGGNNMISAHVTNGTGIGYAAGKVGLFGVTPATRPAATTDIKDALTTLGILQGTSASPLDLDGADLTCDEVQGKVRRTLGPWTQDNVAANQSAVVLNLYGDTTRSTFPGLRAGSLTGLVVQIIDAADARTAGTLTVELIIDGVGTGLTAVIDGTNTLTKATTQATGLDTYASGGKIGAIITTSADWAPTTADISVVAEAVE